MLLKLKRYVVGVLEFFYRQSYLKDYRQFVKSQGNTSALFVFDLDNTLAHTYPYLNQPDTDKMYRTVPAHQNMLNLANAKFNSDAACMVLTARSYRYREATEFWLNKHIKKTPVPLFIVPKVSHKIEYLKIACSIFKDVTYYDDLSYNHENGEVKFYKKEIDIIKKMPLKYIGYEDINIINSK